MKILGRSLEQRYNLCWDHILAKDVYEPVNQFLLVVKTNNFLDSAEKSLLDDQKM